MPLSSSNAVRQLSDGNSQGTVLGRSSTDLIGFYGVTTPVAQATVTSIASTGAALINLVGVLHNMGLINSTGTTL